MSENKPKAPNLDLIAMVQQARMQHDADAVPSQVGGVYWIEAKPQQGDYPSPTSRAGQWVIPTTVKAVDDLWTSIKSATRSGKLGYKSKVSTAPANNQGHPDDRIIHVCTYDADDSADVKRVRAALNEIGITAEISYTR